MSRLHRALALAMVTASVVAVPASAKDFDPGDLRVCNTTRCAPVRDGDVLALLAEMYYGPESPPRATAPQLGAPAFELRFRNGYATGVLATRRLDRFLSFGVHLGHFRRGVWYRVPATAARELRELSAKMRPLRVSRAMLARSR